MINSLVDPERLVLHRGDLAERAVRALLLGSHKAGVGGDRFYYAVARVVEFFTKLLGHGLVQASAEFVHLAIKIAFGAGTFGGNDIDARADQQNACENASNIERGDGGRGHNDRAQTDPARA